MINKLNVEVMRTDLRMYMEKVKIVVQHSFTENNLIKIADTELDFADEINRFGKILNKMKI